MDESLRIRRLERIPSVEEFASEIEPRNVPMVFTGCVKDCKAFSKWNVLNGGLNYLQELAGSCVVEAMLSRSAPIFYGDIRSHERVQLPFGTFIGYCKDLLQHLGNKSESTHESDHFKHFPAFGSENESPHEIYLAQVSILNPEKNERVQLDSLKGDIEMMDSVNLWVNCGRTRSSTHYDPHHNLLCIISGYKQVTLWPPSATPFLYPFPLYGEASNHSAIPLENPDLNRYPRAESLDRLSKKVDLHAGDAVFVPEEWYHQVNSADLTIAVNFWWQSEMMSGMLEHVDSYYLRRILKRFLMNYRAGSNTASTRYFYQPKNDRCWPAVFTSSAGNLECDSPSNHQNVDVKTKLGHGISVDELEPDTLNFFHELVSLVHEHVNKKKPVDSSSQTLDKKEAGMVDTESLFNLEEDPIANLVWNLDPHACQRIFLAMAHTFPRTLEAFILQALSPVGAEVLTRKFEQMDQIMMAEDWALKAFILQALSPVGAEVLTRKFEQMDQIMMAEDWDKFYQIFYGVLDDQSSAMEALLGKESFARQVFKNVLAQHLGVNWSRTYDFK